MVAAAATTVQLGGLARRLIQDQILSTSAAQTALEEARRNRVPFVTHLVNKKLAAQQDIARAGSEEFGVPLLDLDAVDTQSLPIGLVSEQLIRKHHALPLFKRGKRLYVAVSDPTNLEALDEIKFHAGMNADPILVEEGKLAQAIDKSLNAREAAQTYAGLSESELESLDIVAGEDDPGRGVTESDTEDAPIIRFVNKVLLDAITKGASDIHFEPYEKVYRLRFRQDGILHEVATPPIALAPRLSARLKVMARLDISERRVPQDGRMKMNVSKHRVLDFRVNTCPTLFGEKVVVRVLDPASAQLGIDALGFESIQKERLLNAIHKPQGMVLVTGPTGSGKTVTLYTAINILNTPEKNISTVEDPVEINVAGVNQVNINTKAGLTFGAALRAFLRQDPDIIMLGEIRDLETAEIAIRAAQTGHMVLSTLHTNSAPETLTRLVNMGVAPFNIATSVSLIVAQRLARRLCPRCRKVDKLPEETLLQAGFRPEELPGLTLYRPVGCENCTGGYRGRVGVYEVMPISEGIGRLIMEGGNSLQIAARARVEGVSDLYRSGLDKVIAGLTSLEEINRVTKE